MALHLHDDGGKYDQHWLPFDGKIDWVHIHEKITETGYSGATAIEAMNWDYMDLSTKEFLQEAFERAKRLEQATLSGKFQSRR